jgi:hypothetical protein
VHGVTPNASKDKSRSKRRLSLDVLRVGELNKLARHRYSDGNGDYVLPETAEGHVIAMAIITHQRFKPAAWLFKFCSERAPWLDPDEIDRKALKPMKADALGQASQLRGRDRWKLNIHTIGPCDQTRQERMAMRKERKRRRDRERQRLKRLMAGHQSRAAYLAANSKSRAKPWEAEGIHKRTWERRRARTAASPSPTKASAILSDTPAARVLWPSFSCPDMALPPLAPSPRLSPSAGGVYTDLAYLLHLGDCTAVVLADSVPHGGDRVVAEIAA